MLRPKSMLLLQLSSLLLDARKSFGVQRALCMGSMLVFIFSFPLSCLASRRVPSRPTYSAPWRYGLPRNRTNLHHQRQSSVDTSSENFRREREGIGAIGQPVNLFFFGTLW